MVFTSPLEPVPYLFREAWGVFLTSEGATRSGTLTTPKCVPTALCVDDTLETYGQCGFSNRNVLCTDPPKVGQVLHVCASPLSEGVT